MFDSEGRVPLVRPTRGVLQLSEMTDQFFNKVRDFLEIGIGPVGFEHGELGIVSSRNAFIAEVAIQFEDLVEAADEQTLQIKLRRDPQIKIEPERLVMGAERFRRRAARDGLQHRRFHFEKSARLHELPDLAQDRDPFRENVRAIARSSADRDNVADSALRHPVRPCHFSGKRPQAISPST